MLYVHDAKQFPQTSSKRITTVLAIGTSPPGTSIELGIAITSLLRPEVSNSRRGTILGIVALFLLVGSSFRFDFSPVSDGGTASGLEGSQP